MPGTLVGDMRGFRFGPFQAFLVALVAAGTVYLLTTPYSYLALLPGPLLIVLLLLGRYPQFAWYLLIFLIPSEFLTRLSPAQPGITISKFLGIWIIVVALLMVLLDHWRVQRLKSRLWPFLAAFAAANVFSTLISAHLSIALEHLQQLLVAIAIFSLTLLLTGRRGFVRTIPSVLIWGVLLNYVIFLLDFRGGVTMPWVSESPFPRDVSLPGYALPTGYSTYLVFVLPFLVHRFAFSTGFAKKVLYFGFTVLAVSGIMYLGSRAAFLLVVFLAATMCFQYLRLLKPRLIGFLLAGVFLSVTLVTLLMPDWYVGRQKSLVETKREASISGRIDFLKTGWDLFKEKPLFGFGPGSFPEEYSRTPYAAEHAETPLHYRMAAHNTFVEIAVGSGLLGLLGFLSLIVLALRNYWTAAKNFRNAGSRELQFMTNAYLAVFLANLLFFFFISFLTMKHFWMLLALSQLALTLSRSALPADEEAA